MASSNAQDSPVGGGVDMDGRRLETLYYNFNDLHRKTAHVSGNGGKKVPPTSVAFSPEYKQYIQNRRASDRVSEPIKYRCNDNCVFVVALTSLDCVQPKPNLDIRNLSHADIHNFQKLRAGFWVVGAENQQRPLNP